MSSWVRVRLQAGESPMSVWDLSSDVPLASCSMGAAAHAQWRVIAEGVAPDHLEFSWDGSVLWVRALADATLDGRPLESWQRAEGSEIRFGRAVLSLQGSWSVAPNLRFVPPERFDSATTQALGLEEFHPAGGPVDFRKQKTQELRMLTAVEGNGAYRPTSTKPPSVPPPPPPRHSSRPPSAGVSPEEHGWPGTVASRFEPPPEEQGPVREIPKHILWGAAAGSVLILSGIALALMVRQDDATVELSSAVREDPEVELRLARTERAAMLQQAREAAQRERAALRVQFAGQLIGWEAEAREQHANASGPIAVQRAASAEDAAVLAVEAQANTFLSQQRFAEALALFEHLTQARGRTEYVGIVDILRARLACGGVECR